MSILDDPNIVRAIIMDHYQYPRNKTDIDLEGYQKVHMDSESCVDDFYLFLKYNKENDVIEDCKFKGIGCTISTASISILTEMIIGLKKEEALKIIEEYYHLTHNDGEYHEDDLKELMVFSNIYKQANRIKCATIGSVGIEQMLKENK